MGSDSTNWILVYVLWFLALKGGVTSLVVFCSVHGVADEADEAARANCLEP